MVAKQNFLNYTEPPLPDAEEWVVYCDESRHNASPRNVYLSIGSLWLRRSEKERLHGLLKNLRSDLGLNGEIKWNKVSERRLQDYKRLIDFFLNEDAIQFRALVANQKALASADFMEGDHELGFYRMYFALIAGCMRPQRRYLVLLDFKKNKGADRYRVLREKLEHFAKGWAWIDDLTVIDSSESPLAQLSDLLTGAVAGAWSGFEKAGPKKLLVDYISEQLGWPLNKATPEFEGKLLIADVTVPA
ncbi:MAG: DUF3800 domain-containing protein [Verrucomicrobiales bacterium]